MNGQRAADARGLLLALLALGIAVPAQGQVARRVREPPKSFSLSDTSQQRIDRRILPTVDTARLMAQDRARARRTERPGPHRFAVAIDVNFTLENSGTWQELPEGRLWRLRIHSPGAVSHNLGITRFDLPAGAKLWIYDPARTQVQGPYTAHNRSRLGSLWTPVIEGDEIVVEIFVPTGTSRPVIRIGTVNQGYRGFAKAVPGGGTEGTCNNDVICSSGDPWRDQISAVGVYTLNGSADCTGTLLNDVPVDGTPYFLTANHCGVTTGNDVTVVVYWNYQSSTCGTHGPGSTADNQTGATLRASYATSDFALLELSDRPSDFGYSIYHAGWDATPAASTAFPSTVGIHHPSADVKAISFSNTAPQAADWPTGALDAAGNHWRVDWSSGVTEPGSSGSCLFETTHHRCIGQLHGGASACGAAASDLWDVYGMLSVSWDGGRTDATRLSHWLDPAGTGTLAIDGDPHITTVNGVHYDFQGAGEFVALREPGGLEIQVRQAPVSTTFTPGADPYDGIAVGVSLNTAVAARVGTHRVTYEPNLSGAPDPSGMQLRVDGVLTALGATALDLGGGGRIVPTSATGGLEIDFPGGRTLFVTPAWWASQSQWYLNVDLGPARAVDGTAASAAGPIGGIAGTVPKGGWLPPLPDGSSLGPMPGTVHQRYVDLYQRFGEAWRVTDSTSLFDYRPGTSTATFTTRGWPSENGPWVVPGATPVEPASEAVAQQACRAVGDVHAHRNCVFDVRVTGYTGFATTYGLTQQVLGGPAQAPAAGSRTPRLAVFVDAGVAIPSGSFANAFNTGVSVNAGLEYILRPRVSAEGIVGYHRFPGAAAGSATLYQFSVNAKVYLTPPPSRLRPFINGGVGLYTFRSGSSSVGGNVGAGVLYQITPRFGLQASYNFHTVDRSRPSPRFSTVQGGVRLVL